MEVNTPVAQSWERTLLGAVVRHTAALQVLIIVLLVLFNLAYGETIQIANGLGFFNGGWYAGVARDYQGILPAAIAPIVLMRVLPSGLVHYGLLALQAPFSDGNVLLGFRILDGILFIIDAFIWGRIAELLLLEVKSKWLGFVVLFGCFANLKFAFYNPVLTDQTAFALSLLLLYFFLKNQGVGVLAVSILGAFTFPTLIPLSILLFVLPRYESRDRPPEPRKASLLAALLTFGVFVALVLTFNSTNGQFLPTLTPIVMDLLIPSVAIVLLYIFFGSFFLFRESGPPRLGEIMHQVRLPRLVILPFVLIGLVFVVSGPFGLAGMEAGSGPLLTAIARPCISLVSHVVYFGPVVLLALLAWPSIARLVGGYGVGLTLFFLISLVISIWPESRHSIVLFPFLVAFTVAAIQPLNWSPTSGWLAGFLALVYSKIWLPLNWVWQGSNQLPSDPLNPRLQFPYQFYFMNFGPWMSNTMYWVQLAAVLMTAVVLYRLFFAHATKVTSPGRLPEGIASI